MATPVAVVRYGRLRQIAEFAALDAKPRQDCVVRTPRGTEVGHVLAVVERDSPPAHELVRVATEPDRTRASDLRAISERDDLPKVRAVAASHDGLEIVACERLFDGERIVVYYRSSERVPVPAILRELERLLTSEILLQHVGARQRARLCDGCGVCGRTLCCSSFLREMKPVTMRMAKVQGLDLSPRVTAGACGRLKCCLRYENPLYEEGAKGLPRIGWEVRTAHVSGRVLDVDPLRGKVRIQPTPGLPRTIFAAQIEHAAPARNQPLPVAGEPEAESEVEPGWSTLAKRLWRRVNPRKADDDPDEE